MDTRERKNPDRYVTAGDGFSHLISAAPPETELILDADGRIIALKEVAARRFGRKADEMIGGSIFEYFPPETVQSRKALIDQVIKVGKPVSCTDSWNGGWLEDHFHPLFDSSGSVEGIALYNRDITEARQAEEALRESEERYRTAIENSNDGVAILKDSIHLYVNGRFVTMFGYDNPADIIGKSQNLTVHPDDLEKVAMFTLDRQRGKPAPDRYEFKGIRKDGSTIFVEVSATVTTYRGEPVALAYIRDITARKTREGELRLTRYSLENTPDTVFWIRPSGHIVFANESASRKLGYTKEEFLALSVVDVDPDHSRKELAAMGRAMKKGGSHTFRSHHKTRTGRVFPVEITASRVRYENEDLIFCFIRDVSEKELAEERLNLERQKFQVLIEHAPFGMAMFDKDGTYLYVNPKFTEIFGYTLKDLPDRAAWFNKAYPRQVVRDMVISAWDHDDRTKVPGEKMPRTFPVTCKDGTVRTINFITVRLKSDDYVVTYEDITERRMAEEALANEKERLAVTLRSIGDGVIATDPEGKIILINTMAEELTGWKQDEATGMNLSEVFHIVDEKTRLICENPVEKVLRMGKIVGLANHTILVSKTGREIIIADSGAPIRNRDGDIVGVVLVFRDITEKKKLDEELQKMSKLESIGILAGGIAHDFNNILAAVLGNVSLARVRSGATDETLTRRLVDAEQAIMRAKDLTQQLLTFSKGGSPIKQTTSIQNVLRETASFALSGSGVKCELLFPDDLFPVDVDVGQISQVIHNLVINSQQAMPGGGMIAIEAANLELAEGTIEHGVYLQPGRHIRISVADHGVGIAPSHVGKVFDPYFTTKQKGSGLGLATSYSIIKNHGGHVTLESQLGVGTTFYIYLKASLQDAVPRDYDGREHRAPTVRARVLHMDDEDMILQTTRDMLEGLGYDVETAVDGDGAVAKYREAMESGKPFDVAILDITIPGGLGGKDTIRRLLDIDPEVKAIVSSGYSNDPVMAKFADYGFSGIIAKPYRIEDLIDALKKVLGDL